MTLAEQITGLQHAPVAELAARYIEVFGHPPRSRRNAAWLRKRIAFKLQENAFGGLSRVARATLDRLVAEIQLPTTTPAATPVATPADAKLSPGRVLRRVWHGKEVRVLVTADGAFEWDGKRFGSLSAAAFAITNARWSGALFFGLRGRSSKS